MSRIPIAVLGATGTVGQKFVVLLQDHPQFEIAELVASPRSAGKAYSAACAWKQDQPIPARIAEMTVKSTSDSLASPILFSGLDSSVAGEAEVQYAEAGHVVISNSRNHRMDADVPLVIPEINPDHFEMVSRQRWPGAIITNSNCSTMFLAMALAPIQARWGVDWVQVTTMQAISGAGYPGVSSMDILGNVVPYISGEEEKMEIEAQKILGTLTADGVDPASFLVSAACTRVPVYDGHLETVTVKLRSGAAPSMDEVAEVLSGWRGMPQDRSLPSAPARPIEVMTEPDRPQPARDVQRNNGMSTLVGRLRPDPIGSFKMVIMGHNTVRGAAGAAILNAEAFVALGHFDRYRR
ncbi:MAG: aspartate-semialdehyde dehydrogenase [Alkalispirochaeta sp.]